MGESYRLWSIQELREYLQLNNNQAAYRAVKAHAIPCCRLGKELRFDPVLVKDFITQRLMSPDEIHFERARQHPKSLNKTLSRDDIRELVHGIPA